VAASGAIRCERDDDGIVVVTLDDPDQSANTMNASYVRSMAATLERLETDRAKLTGVVIRSAKTTFFAGGDLRDLLRAQRDEAAQVAAGMREIKAQLRRLETLGVPVVAAINGAALGGGLEIALATHHRVAVDAPAVQLGLPEVTLGLLPGAGGVVRTVRMLGVVDALTRLLLRGQRLGAVEAQAFGIVDELVTTTDELVPAAKRWIASAPAAVQPWDVAGYAIPGGLPSSRRLAALLPSLPARLRKELKGANYPAPRHILAAAVEGAQVDFEAASEIEGRYFVDLVTSQTAKNMIQAFFFDLQTVNGNRGRPVSVDPFKPAKMVVLGAGMMGAGIAYVSARAGIEVVLKDVSQEAADRGRAYSEQLLALAVERGRTTRQEADELLARITATDDPRAAAGSELVVEAVFEDPEVKAAVFTETEAQIAADALLGSNTSTLPITSLAESVSRPADFIGLHFFSPVDKMALLEIVRGEKTSEKTVRRALDFARMIKKTPIVVNDSRGFFTSRVIATFIHEGIMMLAEGVPAPSVEQASMQAGFPAAVLALSDELNLKLLRKIREQARAAAERDGSPWESHAADAVIDRMLDEFARPGRLGGAGFYDYRDGARMRLWPGLRGLATRPSVEIPFEDLKERMLFIQALEAVKCIDEGVIESVADANVGSILGIGYPGWTGGVLQYINGYHRGPRGFVARAGELAADYGTRFEPPASLVAKSELDETYRDRAA
jgi:3-hydroxyacyl-CoA dehydrogenase/enoyl-CoA hydratase/3-hydroxybutyryl-CoA epimerase